MKELSLLTPDRSLFLVDAEPACADDWAPFDVLIWKKVGREFRHALGQARSLCGFYDNGTPKPAAEARPLRDTRLSANADEEWAQHIVRDSDPAREVPTRDCANCGATFEIGPRQGQKRFCSDSCNKASWRAGVQAV